jgi:hypothetical protein
MGSKKWGKRERERERERGKGRERERDTPYAICHFQDRRTKF